MNIGKKRFPAHYKGIPEGQLTALHAFNPKLDVWVEKNRQIPFGKNIFEKKNIIKINKDQDTECAAVYCMLKLYHLFNRGISGEFR